MTVSLEVDISRQRELNNSNILEQLKSFKKNETNGVMHKPAVKVGEVIGSALSRIGPYKKLNNSQQVVALIDDVSCEILLKFYKLISQLLRICASIAENVT